uniref:BZIP domain-containing protein n=1 Tax=Ditylenchus dipsaci TaxID=166011 RepID=A0A915DIH8_9BILA
MAVQIGGKATVDFSARSNDVHGLPAGVCVSDGKMTSIYTTQRKMRDALFVGGICLFHWPFCLPPSSAITSKYFLHQILPHTHVKIARGRVKCHLYTKRKPNNNNSMHNNSKVRLNSNNNLSSSKTTSMTAAPPLPSMKSLARKRQASQGTAQSKTSYRMILKDLETTSDKPLKKEMDEPVSGMNDRGPSSSMTLMTSNDGNSPYGSPLSNGTGATLLRSPNNPTGPMLITTSSNQHRLNMIPPAPPSSRMLQNSLGEMPSQPQPQLVSSAASPMLQVTAAAVAALNQAQNAAAAAAAANAASLSLPITHDILSLKNAQHDSLMAGFAQNNVAEWQNSLLSSYQNNNQNNSLSGPPMGLGNRQGSASLTSLSDNDNDGNRKRQVRLLKNREAAKECRRKKKEYVKCLENRVAVLENQNKALIEELKTLKELYCRKEKSEL